MAVCPLDSGAVEVIWDDGHLADDLWFLLSLAGDAAAEMRLVAIRVDPSHSWMLIITAPAKKKIETILLLLLYRRWITISRLIDR